MKKLLKLIIIFAFIFFVASPNHSSAKSKKKSNKISTMSAEALEKMRLNQNLDNLKSSNYQVFETTVYYFVNEGGEAINPLIRHLKSNDDDDKVVIPVIYTLGRIGKPSSRAVPSIIPYLNHDNRDVILTTISALGKIGKASNKAVPYLQQMVFDRSDILLSDMSLRTLKDIKTPEALAVVREYESLEMMKNQRGAENF